MPTELKTKEAYDEAIKGHCIIDFTAAWCGPCRMIGPKFEEIAQSTNKDNADGKIKFYKLDVDSNASAAEAAGISAMPTFKVFKAGKKVGEVVGASEAKLRELVAKHK